MQVSLASHWYSAKNLRPFSFFRFAKSQISILCGLGFRFIDSSFLPSEPLYSVLIRENGVVDTVQEQGKYFFAIFYTNFVVIIGILQQPERTWNHFQAFLGPTSLYPLKKWLPLLQRHALQRSLNNVYLIYQFKCRHGVICHPIKSFWIPHSKGAAIYHSCFCLMALCDAPVDTLEAIITTATTQVVLVRAMRTKYREV